MKKSIVFICLIFLFMLSACSTDMAGVSVVNSEPTAENTTLAEQKSAVVMVAQTQKQYACDQCGDACEYYTGTFACPAIDRTSKDAIAINEEIKSNYDKYVALANEETVSGLAYGFTFATGYEDAEYLILRTAVETVFLHSGGTYSYDYYYYNLVNDCAASIADVCQHFDLNIDIITAYLRLALAETNEYDEDQIASITPDSIDLVPALEEGTYYVRVQNDRLKYESKIEISDLNTHADEIASMMSQSESASEQASGEGESENATDESVSEEVTIEKDVIYMD